ncbi:MULTISPECIES: hypothetical protein [unclassified Streptomyces]|uniref:hypothetical protein n=1 Tax=unclassified Streptomyces TaxID=2593676 RepID=UPI0036B4538E
MRKAKWVAAAAGVVMLVAGCGGEGADKSDAGKGGSASAAPSASGGSGSDGGGKLDAAAVSKEIETAATAAGFTEDPTGDPVSPELKECMVSWAADSEKAADPKKSFADTVAGLTKGGWAEGQTFSQAGSEMKTLTKSNWTLKASGHLSGPLKVVLFVGTDTGPECAALFAADLEKNKKS